MTRTLFGPWRVWTQSVRSALACPGISAGAVMEFVLTDHMTQPEASNNPRTRILVYYCPPRTVEPPNIKYIPLGEKKNSILDRLDRARVEIESVWDLRCIILDLARLGSRWDLGVASDYAS